MGPISRTALVCASPPAMRRPALLAAILVACLSVASSQYDGPVPPRLNIPGAGPARGGGGRLPPPAAVGPRRLAVRGRGGVPRARPQQPLPPRPVVEVEEDSPTTFATPVFQPTTFQPPAFRPAPPSDLPVPSRQQYNRGPPSEEAAFARGPRPSPQPQQDETDDGSEEGGFGTTRARPTSLEDIGSFTRSGEETGVTRPRPVLQEQSSFQRPAPRPAVQQPEEQPSYQRARPSQDHSYQRPRPQQQQVQDEQNLVRGRTELKSSYNRAQLQARPPKPQPQAAPVGARQKKPTAQVISKYRNDNPDGSITWGFENDDGTFKEETIGIDCVTRGKYGYIDPDGVRREYTYTSGIPCDKKNQDSEIGASEGYIDYTNNKYVFPNGQEIDLENMVKNRARRPLYRN